MTTISAVLIVYNEAHLLNDCLESIIWTDEIVVVDLYSTDNSIEIAKNFGAITYRHSWEPIADKVQNYAFSKATKDWILKVDPDERISKRLTLQILEIINNPNSQDAYRLPVKDYIFSKWIRYSGWQGNLKIGLLRLFRRQKIKWTPQVHSQPQIIGTVGEINYDESLDNAIIHFNYKDISQYLEKFNRYTSAEAARLYQLRRPFHCLKLFYQPSKEFFKRYILYKGYKDRLHGLILSLLQSFYVMVSYMKLWELERSKKNNTDNIN